MEAAVMNSLGQNDKILVVNGGSFEPGLQTLRNTWFGI